MKARWLVAVLAVVASAAAVVVYTRARTDASRPVPSTATVSRGDVVETVEATGTLRAVTTVQVGTQVSGTIKALRADFNSEVRRGQIIAELEPSLFQAQVEQARAALVRLQAEARRAEVQSEDAQQKLGRARELSAKALIPASDLETAETTARAAAAAVDAAAAQIVQARASLNQSEVNLGHTIIRSPIDGVVISRNVDVGQTVAASMQAPTLFVLAQDLSAMQVNASVAESDIGRVRPGQRVTFLVDAYPGQVFTGTVSLVRLDPVVEQNVVSYVTTIDVPNPSLVLKPGMTANVTIEVERAAGVLRVPNAALRVQPSADDLAALGLPVAASDEDAPPAVGGRRGRAAPGERRGTIWVVRDGKVVRVAVGLGTSDATHTAIVAGVLGEGDEVLVGLSSSTAATASSPATTRSPLLPPQRRPGGRPPGTP
ncbi:MAG: efflux RND transporter periplasmic adaptor subunit [Vicinamibacterales bacterium]